MVRLFIALMPVLAVAAFSIYIGGEVGILLGLLNIPFGGFLGYWAGGR